MCHSAWYINILSTFFVRITPFFVFSFKYSANDYNIDNFILIPFGFGRIRLAERYCEVYTGYAESEPMHPEVKKQKLRLVVINHLFTAMSSRYLPSLSRFCYLLLSVWRCFSNENMTYEKRHIILPHIHLTR